jgi:hypothetical protein
MTDEPSSVGDAERELAERAFAAVFRSADPFHEPFSADVEARAILFPIETELEAGQFKAVADAARRLDETDMFFRWQEASAELLGRIWRITDFNSYDAIAYRGWDSALWSTAGRWGMFISHEGHGVVGGTARFIESLLAGFPQTEDVRTTFFVTPEMPPPKLDAPDPSARVDQMFDHYLAAGARVDPPARVAATDQGFAFAVECARSMNEEGADITWLPALLRHIYGREEARKILERSGLQALRIDVDDDR